MKPHKTEIRVRYEETDRMGVVYYANYFVWFEIARTEYFRDADLSYRELEEKEHLRIMVVGATASYKSPATYDDLLIVESHITKIKSTSLVFAYKIYCGSRLVAVGETSHVFTNPEGKPIRIPQKIKDKLNA